MSEQPKWDVATCERLGGASLPEWVREMREHFLRTGTYRVEDVRRVLGDPASQVKVSSEPEPATRRTA